MAQRNVNRRRALHSEPGASPLSPASLFQRTVLPRAASTPEICVIRTQTNTEQSDSSNRKYSRPRSVSFHPDIRLYYAATTNDLEEVKMLLESGMADVNAKNPAEGATALHGAAYEGNVECVQYLLENGADVHLRDDDGWTALHAAVCGKRKKCVALLLEAECDAFAENIDGLTPFQMAVEIGIDKLLRQFLKKFNSLMQDDSVPESLV
ncbi:protein phosphatase 1 regulatory subunit 27-like [Montipora capricornis]|uniref:protein phosphatase 1 regulatory subunit 27-like n=1 Tax=Montipora foliosa TaxID=591990 RepID=UPI0035F1CA1F